MDVPVPPEMLFSADLSLPLLAVAALVVVFLGRFLFRLAWRLVTFTAVVIVAFYLGTVVLPNALHAV